MSNYSKITDYAAKDLLLHGDTAKAIKGTEVGAEFDAIATMSATKLDSGGALGTPASGTLTNCTGLPLAGVVDSTTESLGVGSLEVGHASDTTITRVSAGTIAVEGVNLLTTATGAALAGSTTQVFNVEAATADDHAVSRVFGDSRYAALAGSASQAFSVGAGGATASAAVRQDEVVGRNKIIGGDFTTNPWQRGTTFTAPASGTYTADRFRVTHSMDGVVDVLKTAETFSDGVTFSGHWLHVDVTTADATLAAGQYLKVDHLIEGLNTSSLGFGVSGTRYITLSFMHAHTKVGTYCVGFSNNATDRSYVAEYTQAVSGAIEKATITIPVDTTGTWLITNGIGLRIAFAVGAGTTFQGTAGSWQAGFVFATANQVNALDNAANNFKIGLIQLEYGQVATRFEALAVGDVMRQCQRYLPAASGTGILAEGGITTTAAGNVRYPYLVEPRTSPTGITVSAASDFTLNELGLATSAVTGLVFSSASTRLCAMTATGTGTPYTTGRDATLIGANANARIFFTGCELT